MRKLYLGLVALVVAFVGVPLAIGLLTPDDYVGVCANATTHVRLPDQDCQPVRNSDDDWVYFDSGSSVPAVGQSASSGSSSSPGSGNVQLGGVPAQGQQSDDSDDDDNGGNNNGVNSGDDDDDDGGGSSGGDDDGD